MIYNLSDLVNNAENKIQFKNRTFKGKTFQGQSLSHAYFENCEFVGCKFIEAYLVDFVFDNCKFDVCTFYDCEVFGTSFQNVDFISVDFNECNFKYFTLDECHFKDVDFLNCDFKVFSFNETNFEDANCSGSTGIPTQAERLEELFEKTDEGYICYKFFGIYYDVPPYWEIEEGSVITEVPNLSRTVRCGPGINVTTSDVLTDPIVDSKDIWKCLIKFEWLADVCVPYNSHQVRTAKLKLLKKGC